MAKKSALLSNKTGTKKPRSYVANFDELKADVIGDDVVFLDDGMEVGVEFHEEEALNIVLPPHHKVAKMPSGNVCRHPKVVIYELNPALLRHSKTPTRILPFRCRLKSQIRSAGSRIERSFVSLMRCLSC